MFDHFHLYPIWDSIASRESRLLRLWLSNVNLTMTLHKSRQTIVRKLFFKFITKLNYHLQLLYCNAVTLVAYKKGQYQAEVHRNQFKHSPDNKKCYKFNSQKYLFDGRMFKRLHEHITMERMSKLSRSLTKDLWNKLWPIFVHSYFFCWVRPFTTFWWFANHLNFFESKKY